MLCIGRGLMSQPKMMLLDEPSATLAPQTVLDIFSTIGRICRDGMTLLLVERNLRMALLLAKYAYVPRDGGVYRAQRRGADRRRRGAAILSGRPRPVAAPSVPAEMSDPLLWA